MGVKRKQIPESESTVETPREYRWRNKDEISDLLMCTICQDIFILPMRISCGHSYCRKCIDSWFDSCRRDECPTCRQHVIKHATHRDLLAQAFLEREDVFCNMRSCNWMGPLGELDRHEVTCRAEAASKTKAKRDISYKTNLGDTGNQLDSLHNDMSHSLDN